MFGIREADADRTARAEEPRAAAGCIWISGVMAGKANGSGMDCSKDMDCLTRSVTLRQDWPGSSAGPAASHCDEEAAPGGGGPDWLLFV